MPSLSPGTYGENRGLVAQPQLPNGDHRHVMTTAVEPMIKIATNRLGLPRQRGRVAARFTPSTFPPTGTIVRHPGRLFEAPWLSSAIRTTVLPAQSYPSPDFETTINTHRAGAVPAV